MGNTLIAYGNYFAAGVLSGGSWLANLPLTNLQTDQLGKLARSSSADPSATVINGDAGVDHIVRVVALLNHNVSLNGSFRLRGSDDPSFQTSGYDTSAFVWPSVYQSTDLEWESDNFWLGQYKAEDIAGYTAHFIHVLPTAQRLRYWRLEIFDASNPAGFIQAGNVFAGAAWEPSNGIAFGASIGWEDPSVAQTTLSSAKIFDQKPPFRVAKCTIHFMPTDEAFSTAFEIQRRSGIWRQVVFVHDVDDTIHSIRRRFPARLRGLDSLKQPYPDALESDWEFEEITP